MTEPAVYDLKEATLILVDGTSPTPNTLEIKFDEGNLTYTRTRNIEYRKNRGILDVTREGDEEQLEVTFEGRFNAIRSSSGDPVTVTEFLEKEGAASMYSSTGGECQPDAVDLHLEVRHDDCGDMEDELVIFPEFRFETIGGDFKAGTLSVSGHCNVVKPISTRTTLPAE